MRFSETWLREYVNPPVSTDRLVEQLTMAGLEIDSVVPAAPEFSGVVIAQVIEVEAHPNADKLHVCRVGVDGEPPLQIVCGAANVEAGMKAPLARIGARLPGDFRIKKSKLRGVESFGMLCSAKELGLAESSEGLWRLPTDAPVGEDIREYLQLDDSVLDVDLTPNRADCLSVEGIAREVAVINRMSWQAQSIQPVMPGCDDRFPVRVEEEAREACPRYLGRGVQGIDMTASTPMWMQERLRRSGIRSLNAVVDITNYVLLELGQPLHAFDAQRVQGGICVRMARPGEKLTLLNDQEAELVGNELVIADEVRALALAGVMGGRESAVNDQTRDIFLECAFFSPQAIMGRARQHGLHTDSSHRFERGVDPHLQHRAMERLTQLIIDIVGGRPGPIVQVRSETDVFYKPPIGLRAQRVAALLGASFDDAEIIDILQRLGMKVEPANEGMWQVIPPSFRFDIAIEADLIEELARIDGYDHLPTRAPHLPLQLKPVPEGRLPLARIQDSLSDRGYQEAISYSFVDQALQAKLVPELEAVPLANPLSAEMGVMRTTLWAGLLNAARHNLNRQQQRIRLFETGLRFYRQDGSIHQDQQLAGVASGSVVPEQWGEPLRSLDFYDIKADIEALLDLTGLVTAFSFKANRHPALHPGQSAEIVKRNGYHHCGWVGMLHPSLAKEFGFDNNLFLFELDLITLSEKRIACFRPLSNQPFVRRDLALVVPEKVPAQELQDIVARTVGEILVDLVLFDVYRGQGLPEGEKSLALGLTLQHPERTLTDTEVDHIIDEVLTSARDKCGARLRG